MPYLYQERIRLLNEIAIQRALPDEVVEVIVTELQRYDSQALSIFHTIHPPSCYPPLIPKVPSDCFVELAFDDIIVIDNLALRFTHTRVIQNIAVTAQYFFDNNFVYETLQPELRKVSINRIVRLLSRRNGIKVL
jgi:hypothetical protein